MQEHLATLGKVKTQQDSKSCCFFVNLATQGIEARTNQRCGNLPFVIQNRPQAAWIGHVSEILSFWQDKSTLGLPPQFLEKSIALHQLEAL